MIDQPRKVPVERAHREALAAIIDRRYRKGRDGRAYWCPGEPKPIGSRLVDELRRAGYLFSFEVNGTVFVKPTTAGIEAAAILRARGRGRATG